jgi:hypothetical protein
VLHQHVQGPLQARVTRSDRGAGGGAQAGVLCVAASTSSVARLRAAAVYMHVWR